MGLCAQNIRSRGGLEDIGWGSYQPRTVEETVPGQAVAHVGFAVALQYLSGNWSRAAGFPASPVHQARSAWTLRVTRVSGAEYLLDRRQQLGERVAGGGRVSRLPGPAGALGELADDDQHGGEIQGGFDDGGVAICHPRS